MLEKNKDPVSEDLLVILKGSDDPAVRALFAQEDEASLMLERKKGAKFQGVVAKFQHQLTELLAIVEASETHFVRCTCVPMYTRQTQPSPSPSPLPNMAGASSPTCRRRSTRGSPTWSPSSSDAPG